MTSSGVITPKMCQGLSKCKGFYTKVGQNVYNGGYNAFVYEFDFSAPFRYSTVMNFELDVYVKSTCDDDDRLFEWDRTYTEPPTTMPTNPTNIFECLCKPGTYDELESAHHVRKTPTKSWLETKHATHVHLDIFKMKPAKLGVKRAMDHRLRSV